MIKKINIKNFSEVKIILSAATKSMADIGVHDDAGAIADAKSILGLMSLNYSNPVMLVSEDEAELERVYRAVVLS